MHKYDSELRQMMEAMDAVPAAFRFDAGATWQKMEAQLQPSTNKKKSFVWIYWAAASIVLMIAGLIMFGSNGHQAKEVIVGTTKEEHPRKTVLPTTIAIANDDIVSNNKRKKVAVSTIKKQSPSIVAKEEHIVLIDSSNKQQSSSTTFQATILETAVSTNNSNTAKPLIAIAKKTRLKVIHINELDAPPPPVTAKLESKKQLLEQDMDDTEPNKPFWQKKPKQANTTSAFTDNQ